MAGIRCLQERRCWRTRGKSAGSCKTPDVVAWKSSSPCPRENDGPCLPGDGKGDGLSPSLGKPVAGKPPPLPLSHTATVTPVRSPPPAQGTSPPPPQEPELALGKAGAGPHEESRSTLHPPSLPPPWGTHGPWGGDAAQAIRDAVLLWQTGLSGGSVCVCGGGCAVFLRKQLVPEPRHRERKHQGAHLKF